MTDFDDLVDKDPEPQPENVKAQILAGGSPSFGAAARASIGKRMTDEEAAAVAAEAEDVVEDPPEVDAMDEEEETRATGDAEADECRDPRRIPSWAKVPAGFKMPPGVQVFFVRVRRKLTRTPEKGDRVAILWELTPADEAAAYKRAGGDDRRVPAELVKQMVRAFDGQKVDYSRGSLSGIETFWREIGARGRTLLRALYNRAHNVDAEDAADFFLRCVAVRNAARSPRG